jgi:chemotaxis protein CheX
MRQEFVNPFLAPAQKVWQTEFKLDLKIKSAQAVFYQYTTEDITAIIGVSGKLAGNVLYGFGEKSSLSICERMIGPGVNPHDPLALSALGEIANIITGNAATQLAASGYDCDIAPPVIVEPRGSTITCSVPRQILVVFTSDLGDLSVRIGLAENARYHAKAA